MRRYLLAACFVASPLAALAAPFPAAAETDLTYTKEDFSQAGPGRAIDMQFIRAKCPDLAGFAELIWADNKSWPALVGLPGAERYLARRALDGEVMMWSKEYQRHHKKAATDCDISRHAFQHWFRMVEAGTLSGLYTTADKWFYDTNETSKAE